MKSERSSIAKQVDQPDGGRLCGEDETGNLANPKQDLN